MEYGMGLNHTDKGTIALLRAELATLRAENERLREALKAVVITKGRKMKYDGGYETYDPIDISKEALK